MVATQYKELEFLESEMAGKGISHKANVTMTPFGIAWINITNPLISSDVYENAVKTWRKLHNKYD